MFDGGFLTSSQNNAPLDSPSGKKRGNGPQSIRPVTIKQMLGVSQPHPDGEYRIDDAEVHQVSAILLLFFSLNILFFVDYLGGTCSQHQ